MYSWYGKPKHLLRVRMAPFKSCPGSLLLHSCRCRPSETPPESQSHTVASLESAEGISNGQIRIMGLSDAESAESIRTQVRGQWPSCPCPKLPIVASGLACSRDIPLVYLVASSRRLYTTQVFYWFSNGELAATYNTQGTACCLQRFAGSFVQRWFMTL